MSNYRHEIKLLISEAEAASLRSRLGAVLEKDPHAGPSGEYFIRSLYFDDLEKRSYFEKLAGTPDRKKYRLRIYGLSGEVIKLECKEKRGSMIRKRSATVGRETAEALCRGDFSPLEGSDDPLVNEIFTLSRKRGLSPSVVVDYDREAYVHPLSNLRLTFDKALHAGIEGSDIFDGGLFTVPVFEDGGIIFEIKYDEILPKFVQELLADARGQRLALSKFTLCVDRLKSFKPSIRAE